MAKALGLQEPVNYSFLWDHITAVVILKYRKPPCPPHSTVSFYGMSGNRGSVATLFHSSILNLQKTQDLSAGPGRFHTLMEPKQRGNTVSPTDLQ